MFSVKGDISDRVLFPIVAKFNLATMNFVIH